MFPGCGSGLLGGSTSGRSADLLEVKQQPKSSQPVACAHRGDSARVNVVSFATEVRSSYHANQGIDQGTSRSARAAAPPTCIQPGDPLDANIEDGRIVLTPRRKRPHRIKIVTDPVTGLPALSAGPKAPTMSSKEVEEILANFP